MTGKFATGVTPYMKDAHTLKLDSGQEVVFDYAEETVWPIIDQQIRFALDLFPKGGGKELEEYKGVSYQLIVFGGNWGEDVIARIRFMDDESTVVEVTPQVDLKKVWDFSI